MALLYGVEAGIEEFLEQNLAHILGNLAKVNSMGPDSETNLFIKGTS